MESMPTCKALTALYLNENIFLAWPRVTEFVTKGSNYKIVIEEGGCRRITITSEKEVKAHDLYVILTRVERLLMLFDGVFFPMTELEFTDSDNTSETMLQSYKNNLLAGRLSYFSSADFCRYSIEKLIDFHSILTSELFSNWEGLLEELDVVHQMYLYSMSDSKLTRDVKAAFLIELAEPLIEVVKKYTNFYASLKPGDKGTSLKMCIDALVTKYGRASINQAIINAFSSEVEGNENIEILTRLPIDTYWTTNYDQLLEECIRKNNRKVEVKVDQEHLATTLPDRDAVLYKMHGDVNRPSDGGVVLTDF